MTGWRGRHAVSAEDDAGVEVATLRVHGQLTDKRNYQVESIGPRHQVGQVVAEVHKRGFGPGRRSGSVTQR